MTAARFPAAAAQAWFLRAPHAIRVLPGEAIAEVAAARIAVVLGAAVARRGRAVFLPSAGRTPLGTYALLRDAHRHSLDWSRVVCVQMDEYEGLGDRDPRGFADMLRRELVAPLGIDRFFRFHDGAGALRRPLAAYERAVRALGGIDCAVQGIGRNGHIAFNEPGDPGAASARSVRLAPSTCAANGVPFTRGVTLGTAVLGEARETLVLMLGAAKRQAAEALLFRPGGVGNPAAALRRCGRVVVFLDPAAAPARLALPPVPIVLAAHRAAVLAPGRPDDALADAGAAAPSRDGAPVGP